MKEALIYVGGEIDPAGVFPRPGADTLTIAADSGYRTAQTLGVTPKILLGDFDSLPDVPQTADFPYVFPDKNRVLLYFCSSVLKPSETILD